MNDISFCISENTLLNLNKFIRKQNLNLLQKIIKLDDIQQIENLFFEPLEIKKKDISEKDLCMSRVWNDGEGGRCHFTRQDLNSENEKDYCKKHQKEFMKKGFVRYGRIDEISPFRLSKKPDEPYQRCCYDIQGKQCKIRKNRNSNYCTIHSKKLLSEKKN